MSTLTIKGNTLAIQFPNTLCTFWPQRD
uniref:Uncharacterized protein n=1 Tax=Rhizophora mucronata TaxID=61149 RepID=A0A2P2NY53_RHIMU